jgi:Ran GTPase-activating protein (RanGAP) involved in mRNA processing and transport
MSFLGSRRRVPNVPAEGSRIRGTGLPPGASLREIVAAAAAGTTSFSAAVSSLRRAEVRRLELDGANVGDAEARVLEEYLSTRDGATEIYFSRITFGDGAFHRICNGVSQNSALSSITITNACLEDADVEKLAAALSMSAAPVSQLDLSNNSLSSPVGLIEKLRRNNDLAVLNLSGNQLLCSDTLAGAITGCWPALSEVVLKRTGIHGGDAETLIAAAEEGSTRFADFSAPRKVSL